MVALAAPATMNKPFSSRLTLCVLLQQFEKHCWPIRSVEGEVAVVSKLFVGDMPNFDTDRREFDDGVFPNGFVPVRNRPLEATQHALRDANRHCLWCRIIADDQNARMGFGDELRVFLRECSVKRHQRV